LGWGVEEFFSDENDVRIGDFDAGHGVGATDNESWKNKRQKWVDAMWANKDNIRI
jgi:hypothetical protein